ncbi:hypothetical protein ASPZODRAFT_960157 [Penicilliopsis zonata CBS 506.65]|uniref:Uncharacterized protein n=1 Tax=Penicilliopsis zonata CBS 506.65 TaxID=1073090 RepID=A0A1L9SQX1_9EURO|nr:hypothetical protein ASPZODRAFT_960157 [Penicilliopsis zonata CBS 506.65]OJJ49516.1 hypothetical protein ASPZODRAFT_960157 [Penicilliopsis zonata CBS 506.65]
MVTGDIIPPWSHQSNTIYAPHARRPTTDRGFDSVVGIDKITGSGYLREDEITPNGVLFNIGSNWKAIPVHAVCIHGLCFTATRVLHKETQEDIGRGVVQENELGRVVRLYEASHTKAYDESDRIHQHGSYPLPYHTVIGKTFLIWGKREEGNPGSYAELSVHPSQWPISLAASKRMRLVWVNPESIAPNRSAFESSSSKKKIYSYFYDPTILPEVSLFLLKGKLFPHRATNSSFLWINQRAARGGKGSMDTSVYFPLPSILLNLVTSCGFRRPGSKRV